MGETIMITFRNNQTKPVEILAPKDFWCLQGEFRQGGREGSLGYWSQKYKETL